MHAYVQGRHICGAWGFGFFRSPQPSLAALATRLSCWKSHLVLIWMSGLFEASAVSGVTDGPLKGPEQQDVPLNSAEVLAK